MNFAAQRLCPREGCGASHRGSHGVSENRVWFPRKLKCLASYPACKSVLSSVLSSVFLSFSFSFSFSAFFS